MSEQLPRILSGRQPWWWMLIYGEKGIENRGRPMMGDYTGPLLLHASKRKSERGEREFYDSAVEWVSGRFGLAKAATLPRFDDLAFGGIIGRCNVVDVIPPHRQLYADEMVRKYPDLDLRWWMRDSWGYVIRDVRPTKFVPWSGAQGLQTATPELMASLGNDESSADPRASGAR
jgi:hypothetical protein